MNVPPSDVPQREAILNELRAIMPALRERYGVSRLALFGSVARNEACVESDVDLLVAFDRSVGLGFFSLAAELEQYLGYTIDLTTFATFQESLKGRRRRIALRVQEELCDVSG